MKDGDRFANLTFLRGAGIDQLRDRQPRCDVIAALEALHDALLLLVAWSELARRAFFGRLEYPGYFERAVELPAPPR